MSLDVFIFILIFAHFVADYVLQSTWIWEAKIINRWAMFIHCFLYAGCIMIAIGIYTNWFNWWAFGLIFTSHYLIDRFRIWFSAKRWWDKEDRLVTFVDQLLHFLVLAIIIVIYH